MCNSSNEGKEFTLRYIQRYLNNIESPRLLDVGVGQGTYYSLLNQHLHHPFWTGIEIYSPYIERFRLRERYDQIFNIDVRTFTPDHKETYHVILCGDVLEHMTKEQAVATVARLHKHCDILVISIPIRKWPQHADENPWQEHVKDDWTTQEVMQTFDTIIASEVGTGVGVFITKGNLNLANPEKND